MMNLQGAQQLAQMLVQQNPQMRNHPGIQAILRGDAAAGQQYAQNLCGTYGVNPQEAAAQAEQFFSQQGPNQGMPRR